MKQFLVAALLLAPFAGLAAQDTSLHDNLLPGEGWQEAVTGYASQMAWPPIPRAISSSRM
ncbi:hypothetical protein [Verrucomicrobium spinosum]|uniref:hypothetical protein n=1 Tax=Verrucomicrobium spinosum TaxID=2736 RepID=UPI0009466EE4|nr:hypothetical protein [Verrucomicrobium spinosum]